MHIGYKQTLELNTNSNTQKWKLELLSSSVKLLFLLLLFSKPFKMLETSKYKTTLQSIDL